MTTDRFQLTDSRILAAVDELKGLISGRFPTTVYQVGMGEDPDGVYLHAFVDIEDRGEVVDVFLDRLVDLQLDDDLPIYVAIGRTPERNAEIWRSRSRESEVVGAAGP